MDLALPEGLALVTPEGRADADAAAALLEGTYWNVGLDPDLLARAHLGSQAWLGVRDTRDERRPLVGSARAISDYAKRAWIYDVIVAPELRGRGVGQALVAAILAHPAVRDVKYVHLGTRDAQSLYARFGFVDRASLPPRGFVATEMVLVRAR
jgi:ribosomal protein S18 acetylase RimI-like enzyme